MTTLSVVVSVFNGEKFLSLCLASVKGIADEIIVVDHESTDRTVSIAKKFTKKIFSQKNDTASIDTQKNFGFEKATKDWILSLDADEMVSPELSEKVQQFKAQATEVVAFQIPRKNIIFGKWIEHSGWYPDYQLRLFKKGSGKYVSEHVHEHLIVEGITNRLEEPLIHENYQSVYQFLHKNLTVYAPNEAKFLQKKGYEFSFADCIRFPVKEFMSRFFAREGYKDGFHGLILSLLMAFYHFCIFLYLWEDNKFIQKNAILPLLSTELRESGREMNYWQKEVEIRQTKNPASKVLLKAKRKLGL